MTKLPKQQIVGGVTYTREARPNIVRKTINGKNVSRICGRIVVYVKQPDAIGEAV